MKYFKHGDTVTAAALNAIVDTINDVEAQSQLSSYVFGGRDAVAAGTIFYGIHQRRWLAYKSTGEIRDTANPLNIMELPDCNDAFCMFDLHTVPWLKYGDLYAVEGSEFALETDTDA